jgi:lipopolysaccharide export LptBFGC system permease protein LptF
MRVPLELYLYIGRELLRLFLLTGFVLVWIIAFAAAVKPISEGQLSVADTLRYLTLGLVPMLPFAAPFAAGFAATLSYHRLASDNELLAAVASGISYRAVLAPALALGVVLTVGLMIVSHALVPGVMRQMERMLQADIGTMLVSAINRGDGVRFEGLSIYADEAISYGPEPETGAFDQIDLLGLAVADRTDQGDQPLVYTGRRAFARLYATADETVIAVHLFEGAGRFAESENHLIWNESLQRVWRVPSRIKHDPKFETWQGLAEVYEQPDLYPEIREKGLEMAQALGRWHITRAVQRQLRRDGVATLVSADSEASVEFRIFGSDVRWQAGGPVIVPFPPDEPDADPIVRVQRHEADGTVIQYDAPAAKLTPDHYERGRDRGAYLNLQLTGQVAVRDLSDPEDRNVLDGYEWQKLHLPRRADPSERFSDMSTVDLLAEASNEKYEDDQFIRPHSRALAAEIAELRREIISKHHERAALSVSCLVMLFAGAVIAIRLRAAMPLVVYMWSFLPALGTIILISSGQQVMQAQSIFAGAWVLWSGVAALGAIGLVVYAQVRKH